MARADTVVTVLPDGCRDILVTSKPGQPPVIRLTDWDMGPQTVKVTTGSEFVGYRLRPGSTVEHRALAQVACDPGQIEALIESEAPPDEEITDIIAALSVPFATVQGVSRSAGVTMRTLQRRFGSLSLPPPDFWRLLARARKAALALPCEIPLVEIADMFGYSDQAHMTRDFMRWFELTPKGLRRDTAALDGISQPALGNWTGEQISIR